MHLFPDDKVALREAVTRPCSRLSPSELISGEAAETIARCRARADTCAARIKDSREDRITIKQKKELGNDEHQ